MRDSELLTQLRRCVRRISGSAVSLKSMWCCVDRVRAVVRCNHSDKCRRDFGNQVLRLVPPWSPSAARSYDQPWGECADGFRQILSSLESLRQSLGLAAQQYQEQETKNTRSIRHAGTTTISGQDDAADARRDAHARRAEGISETHEGLNDLRGALWNSHAVFSGVHEFHRRMWPSAHPLS